MNDGARIDGGCTWIRTRKPEATALQAAELAMLFNTSEVGRRRGNRTPLHDDNTDSYPTAPEPSGRLSIKIGRGSRIRTCDDRIKAGCLGPLGDTPTVLADPAGLEPATYYLTGSRSNLLS